MRIAVFLIAVVPLLSGCLAADSPGPSPSVQVPGDQSFPAVVAMTECPYGCWESSIAVDPTGRVFTTGGTETPIRVAADGSNFSTVPAPPAPPNPGSSYIRADALVQVDPKGRLWYTALLGDLTTTLAWNVALPAIQVARSDDAGATWAVNTKLALTDGSGEMVNGADRQWLGFDSAGNAVLTYSQINGAFSVPAPVPAMATTGIWSARSTDGGASWTGWTRAAPFESRQQMGQHGPPVFDSTGRVFFPHFANAQGVGGSTREVRVAISADRGASWSSRTVSGPPASLGAWFPSIAVSGDDAVHVAWIAGTGAVYVSTGTDGGTTWGAPVRWNPESVRAAQSPWVIALADGQLAVAWAEQVDTNVARIHVTKGTAQGPDADVSANFTTGGQYGRASNTDMAYGVAGPDGAVWVVWSDAAAKTQYVARV